MRIVADGGFDYSEQGGALRVSSLRSRSRRARGTVSSEPRCLVSRYMPIAFPIQPPHRTSSANPVPVECQPLTAFSPGHIFHGSGNVLEYKIAGTTADLDSAHRLSSRPTPRLAVGSWSSKDVRLRALTHLFSPCLLSDVSAVQPTPVIADYPALTILMSTCDVVQLQFSSRPLRTAGTPIPKSRSRHCST